jgi:hypothetical protein
MTNLIENIKSYFIKKDEGKSPLSAPEGMCPTCWGHDEWDNQYYKVVRDKHLLNKDIYSSFISKIVDKHVTTSHKHGNKYICTTCDKEL